MSQDDDETMAVIPRPALLAALAERHPEGPEGQALGALRRVFGQGVSGHLDQGDQGLMLVIELVNHLGAVQRVGYILDAAGKMVLSWQLQDTVTGELEQKEMLKPVELEAALRMLTTVGVVRRRD